MIDVRKLGGFWEITLLCPGKGNMAERLKEESLQEGQLKMSESVAPNAQEAFKAQTQATVGSQSPSPSVRAGSLILRQGRLSNFNRSLSRSSRRSGNWTAGMDTARLLMGWGSTRRKEILLQTSQAKPMWLMASQRDNISVDVPQDQEQLDVTSEDLCLALDPLEHEWMLTVAQGDAENILHLLAKDPSLLSRRDFVTGFTVLHWLAKHGRHEDLIKVITFAEKNQYPVDINVFAASGRLTPLHLAALQGHEMVIKVLVGAYGANTSLRDHNGRKAWQYLPEGVSRELKELSGASEEDLAVESEGNINNNCAPSRRGGIIHALKGDHREASGGRQSQRASLRLSYFRNMFSQAVAFFKEL